MEGSILYQSDAAWIILDYPRQSVGSIPFGLFLTPGKRERADTEKRERADTGVELTGERREGEGGDTDGSEMSRETQNEGSLEISSKMNNLSSHHQKKKV